LKLKLFPIILFVLLLAACNGLSAEEPESSPAETADVSAESGATPESEQPAATSASDTDAEPAEESSEESSTEEEETTGEEMPSDEMMTTASGLKYTILSEGDGEKPAKGSVVQVHYTGTLEDGTKFDSSLDRGEPIQFALGVGQVIPGWDEGIALLGVGDKAEFIIPSELAYGERGAGAIIPPNATLHFEVELVGIQPGPPDAPSEISDNDYITTDSGLKYYDMEAGSGAAIEAGQTALVQYTGWLEDGTMFDSSLTRGKPFGFVVGTGQVIPGWDEGVQSMSVGGKRQLVIPSDLAYGDKGAGGVIPPGATLIFEVELVEIK
jgi:peptidylprolyl isomerase